MNGFFCCDVAQNTLTAAFVGFSINSNQPPKKQKLNVLKTSIDWDSLNHTFHEIHDIDVLSTNPAFEKDQPVQNHFVHRKSKRAHKKLDVFDEIEKQNRVLNLTIID